MLELRPNCECCDRDLPADSPDARICSFECTFCADCVRHGFQRVVPELRRQLRAPPDPSCVAPCEISSFRRACRESARGLRQGGGVIDGILKQAVRRERRSARGDAGPALEYNGYRIRAAPFRDGGQFQTAGIIEKDFPDGMKEHRFIRAEKHGSQDEAAASPSPRAADHRRARRQDVRRRRLDKSAPSFSRCRQAYVPAARIDPRINSGARPGAGTEAASPRSQRSRPCISASISARRR